MSTPFRCPYCGILVGPRGKGIVFCPQCRRYLPRNPVSSRSLPSHGKIKRPRLYRLPYGYSEAERARQLGTDDWLKREAVERIREEERKLRKKRPRRIN